MTDRRLPSLSARGAHTTVHALAFALALSAPSALAHASDYFVGLEQPLHVSPHGNAVALSCHNCYRDDDDSSASNESPQDSIAIIERAIDADADLIELDVRLYPLGPQAVPTVIVEHEVDDAGPPFAELLASVKFHGAAQPLFMELKEAYLGEAESREYLHRVFRAIESAELAHAASQPLTSWTYAHEGRPLFVRAIKSSGARSAHQHLALVDAVASEFPLLSGHVRTHVLFESSAGATVANQIQFMQTLPAQGIDGVEFEYRQRNLYGALMAGKQLGLGVGVYTIPASSTMNGKTFVASLRDDVDFITTDFVSSGPSVQPQVSSWIGEATSLVYMNTSSATAYPLQYHKLSSPTPTVVGFTSQTLPSLEVLDISRHEDRVGGSMVFQGAHFLKTLDADNDPSGGYLVSAVVNFDDLSLASGVTRSLVAKSDAGGFSLEQFADATGTRLRFGVFVGNRYVYANCPMSHFNGTDSYVVTGTYSGTGSVQLWANNTLCESTPTATDQGVKRNDSPIIIGADPQGSADQRFFFNGKVQQVLVQKWSPVR